VSQYQKGKTNLDFTEATAEVAWHQLFLMHRALPPNQQCQSTEGIT